MTTPVRPALFLKGTSVRIRTTNGGEIVAPLLENHRATYDAVILVNGNAAIITPWRIKSIEVAR